MPRRFWKDESGQVATEYIFILSVLVMVGLTFARAFRPFMTGFMNRMQTYLKDQMFNDRAFHRFRI